MNALVEITQTEFDIITKKSEEKMPFEAWAELVGKLLKAQRDVQFALADCLIYGLNTFGDDIWQVIDQFDYSYDYVKNLMYVASQVEYPRRRDSLRFSHHQEVAPLEPEQQEYWLNKAESEKLTVKELREAIRETRAEKRESSDQVTQKERAGAWLKLMTLIKKGIIVLHETQSDKSELESLFWKGTEKEIIQQLLDYGP